MLADGTPADDVQVSLSGVGGGFAGLVGGRGSCSVTLTSSKHRTVQILICIAVSNAEVNSSPVHVMPLVFGPLTLTQSDQVPSGDELLEFYRPLGLPCSIKPLLIREQPELAIPGKIWDSALFASELALELTLRHPTDQNCNILDLSCGTGVCGLWLAAALDTRKRHAKIILSDLTEALPVIQANIAQSASFLDVEALSLCWGNKADLQQLEAICTTRNVTAIDVVIACDLIYEAELLPVLASTLKDIATMSQRPTTIVIGYKQRGLTQAEKAGLWRTFEEACGFKVARMQHVACTSMLAEKVEADFVGLELWLLTMSG
ncbi:putative methyltransferase-domain-containing protein [Protomyces lactucae-debilis]|uniref:Putative methyltransferase-domain-containing protein n=1 Tax=Protomyces lactucae-debilis TaxID=2754530 RepID=A0A1Y2FII7_PROLT|nr:putative methyltransferase-domain-containing protein [Protomyces lactucae-debilis]ORY83782.1 putative methyltransferase-domain-containing protein [Protomyces lactucae-debilis]